MKPTSWKFCACVNTSVRIGFQAVVYATELNQGGSDSFRICSCWYCNNNSEDISPRTLAAGEQAEKRTKRIFISSAMVRKAAAFLCDILAVQRKLHASRFILLQDQVSIEH